MTAYTQRWRSGFYGLVAIASATTAPFAADAASTATWAPKASEQLIRLPGDFLKKAVDNDFARSPLASALNDTDERIQFKKATLLDLRNAIDRADGDMKVELEHRFLGEKRAYIEQMKKHQELRRRRAETKIRLYERLLGKLGARERAMTPSQARLIDNQKQARQRMESSAAKIDARLLQASMAPESRYAREYGKNLAAIENLVQAINAHPMNQQPEIDGQPISQQAYLRQLIAGNESELAILNQQQTVIGYMAKLVSLDALALSEGIQVEADGTSSDTGGEDVNDIASAVDLFTNP